MGVTKRDVSGIFDADLKGKRPRKAAVLDKVFDLSPKGITFLTDTFINEWTEVGVEMPTHSLRGSKSRWAWPLIVTALIALPSGCRSRITSRLGRARFGG